MYDLEDELILVIRDHRLRALLLHVREEVQIFDETVDLDVFGDLLVQVCLLEGRLAEVFIEQVSRALYQHLVDALSPLFHRFY